jgi:ferric-dicitrate binding protein FerR (iron transport regulator)
VVRSLWARDRGGRFRTYGNNSVATARGTAWVTRDRCDGTVTRVREGAVAIKDRRTGRTVIVRAGGSYLARR